MMRTSRNNTRRQARAGAPMNRYYDPFSVLVGQQAAMQTRVSGVPAYVGQGLLPPQGGGPVMGPVPNGGPGPFGPPGMPGSSCYGPPQAAIMPSMAVANVSQCAQPFGLTSDDGSDPIEPGETKTLTSSPQGWICASDLDIPITVSAFFLITSIKFGNCELLQNGPIHADTLSSQAVHPCLQGYSLCPGQTLSMTVKNIGVGEGALAMHFYATFWGATSQNCVPCSPWG